MAINNKTGVSVIQNHRLIIRRYLFTYTINVHTCHVGVSKLVRCDFQHVIASFLQQGYLQQGRSISGLEITTCVMRRSLNFDSKIVLWQKQVNGWQGVQAFFLFDL